MKAKEHTSTLYTPCEEDQVSELQFTFWEKTVFSFLILFILSITVVSLWSGILLFSGRVEGGGPLGFIVEIIVYHLLP